MTKTFKYYDSINNIEKEGKTMGAGYIKRVKT
jgi:hypothetical protein